VEHFLDEIGYFAELRRSEKEPESAESRIPQSPGTDRHARRLRRVSQPPSDRLQAYLETRSHWTPSARKGGRRATGDAVTLITMHSCKGLEFPSVYIVGMEDGLLPHSRSKAENTLDEEAAALMWPSPRRCRRCPSATAAGRKKYGASHALPPLRFLTELPAEFVEHASEKGIAACHCPHRQAVLCRPAQHAGIAAHQRVADRVTRLLTSAVPSRMGASLPRLLRITGS